MPNPIRPIPIPQPFPNNPLVGTSPGTTPGSAGVLGQSNFGVGVWGQSIGEPWVEGSPPAADGVLGEGKNGVHGESGSATDSGVWGNNTGGGYGVAGSTNSATAAGVWGDNAGTGETGVPGAPAAGVRGTSHAGTGVYGKSSVTGVAGEGGGFGVTGSGTFTGVDGISEHIGVRGTSQKFVAVYGFAGDSGGVSSGPEGLTPFVAQVGVYGRGSPLVTGAPGTPIGVFGISNANGGQGVAGLGTADTESTGVAGISTNSDGVYGRSDEKKPNGWAGFFAGKVHVSGFLEKAGGGFKIDHPLDPANQYLVHSFVESSEMKNVYDGSITLDAKGEATVTLPGWFEGLNKDYRYQLTAIGTPAPNLHVAQQISKGRFKIAGGKPRMQVCWQVTGVRKDRWADAHPMPVEVKKPKEEQGFYLHPELYEQPEEKGVDWARNPAQAKLFQEMRKIGVRAKVGKRKQSEAAKGFRRLKARKQLPIPPAALAAH
jgi:hypothetical protein